MEAYIILLVNDMWFKLKYYLLSLWVLFILQVVIAINIESFYTRSLTTIIHSNWVPILFLIFVILDLCIWISFRKAIKRTPNLPVKLVRVTEKNPDFLVFFSTIIMPLITVQIVNQRTAIIMATLLVVLFLILLRTNQIVANPTLAILGFHLYEIEYSIQNDGIKSLILSRNILEKGDYITWIRLDENLIMGTLKEKNRSYG